MTALPTETFSIRDILRDAVESTTSPANADVAAAAYAAIDPADYPEAVRQLLDAYTPHYVIENRPTRRGSRTRKSRSKDARRRRPTGPRLATAIEQFLASREYSPFRGQQVFLRDCTIDDIESIAADRYARAEQMHAKGDWWQRVGKELTKHGAETVGELPEAVIDELMANGDEEDEE